MVCPFSETMNTMQSAKLYDMSFNLANHLNQEKIEAIGMKDASLFTLEKNDVMLSGSIILRSIPMEENFPFPGMVMIFLVGSILPSPAAYISGVDVKHQYELIDTFIR